MSIFLTFILSFTGQLLQRNREHTFANTHGQQVATMCISPAIRTVLAGDLGGFGSEAISMHPPSSENFHFHQRYQYPSVQVRECWLEY